MKIETKFEEKIKWIDSSTYKEWYNEMELDNLFEDSYKEIISIGFLVKENKNQILLAGNNDNNENFSNITIIPKVCIIKREKIKRGKDES